MEKEKLDYMVLFRIGQKLYEMLYAGLIWQSGLSIRIFKRCKIFLSVMMLACYEIF